jgi:hypothetical protein
MESSYYGERKGIATFRGLAALGLPLLACFIHPILSLVGQLCTCFDFVNYFALIMCKYVSSENMIFLVQKWPHKLGLLDLGNQKNSKNLSINP